MKKPISELSINFKLKTVVTVVVAMAFFIFSVAVVWANTQSRLTELEEEDKKISLNRFTDKDGDLLQLLVDNNQRRIEAMEGKLENISEKIDNKFEKLFYQLATGKQIN